MNSFIFYFDFYRCDTVTVIDPKIKIKVFYRNFKIFAFWLSEIQL